MRIGIYNRYWSTRGGGERYAGAMAQILSRDHQVELLGPSQVDLEDLASHLGLDLSRSRFRLLPEVSERRLAPLTAEYDLFINCTYLSRLPTRAKRSVYLVLFPQRVWPPGLVRLARRIVRAAPLRPPAVVAGEGFFPREASGLRWCGPTGWIRLEPGVFRDGQARLRFGAGPERSLGDVLLAAYAPGLSWRVEGDTLILEAEAGPVVEPVDVELRCRTFSPCETGVSPDGRRLGVNLVGLALDRRWSVLARWAEKIQGRIDAHDAEIPSRYDLLLAISEFTSRWIAKRWDQPSEVLTPPVDVSLFTVPEPSEKAKVILSVGRFFHGSHNKKHVEMLEVFRRMHDRGEIPAGWEYHLVGNLHRGRLVDLEYFADVERLAEGYPVKLLIDLDLEQLVEEYRRASIFWHAAGWGESERRQPEKFEHFGMTTCEAMSSGCIPVVIAKAGQLEIVEHGETGFLFTRADELAAITKRLIDAHGEPWTHQLMERAAASVQRFAVPLFEERLLEILREHDVLG